ncbi:MAG: hypothetical protein LBM95_06595 [Lactobacillales bacterium]|jgi:hypothetical protein|nr:hypothetical protein [Lactobacillales bacterium]
MEFIDQLSGACWKNATDEMKQALFEQVLAYHVKPELEVTNIQLKEFELFGIKNRSFEFMLANETFVFIPGQREVILGWEIGSEGLPTHELLGKPEQKENVSFWANFDESMHSYAQEFMEEQEEFDLETMEGIDAYINLHTTSLRKVDIPPMIVGKYALPASTNFIGRLDMITGEFEGETDLFGPFEKKIRQLLFPDLSLQESLVWSAPERFLEMNEFYLEYVENLDYYRVFLHQQLTLEENYARIHQWGFELLDENQWEYVVGAGTRRLFRWGNELNIEDNPLSEQPNPARKRALGENMFGAVIDTTRTRFEITNEEQILKLGLVPQAGTLIENVLPLSSYYQSYVRIMKNEILSPLKYLYRKALIIRNN